MLAAPYCQSVRERQLTPALTDHGHCQMTAQVGHSSCTDLQHNTLTSLLVASLQLEHSLQLHRAAGIEAQDGDQATQVGWQCWGCTGLASPSACSALGGLRKRSPQLVPCPGAAPAEGPQAPAKQQEAILEMLRRYEQEAQRDTK